MNAGVGAITGACLVTVIFFVVVLTSLSLSRTITVAV